MLDMYLELFITYLENTNKAENTIKQYSRHIKHFFSFLEEKNITEIEQVKTIHLDLYASQWIKSKNKSSTRKNKMDAIKSLFKFLQTREYIEKNPTISTNEIQIKDVDRKEKFVLTPKESEKLMNAVTKYARNKSKAYLMMLLMLKCALRVNEVCELKVSNIDMKTKTITIYGKRGKKRVIPLFPEMIDNYKLYIKARKNESEYLFTSKNTESPMKPRAIHDFVKSYVKKAKINKNIGPHALRRTAATRLLQSGARITSIQKFMGHSSVSTTEMYLLETESEILKEIRDKSQNIISKKSKGF